MKQTFVVEIDCPAIESYGFHPISQSIINICLKHGMNHIMEDKIMEDLKISVVEQSVEPLKDQEFSQKTLALSGNLAWENRTEDYLGDG